ncbi:hypothetical protein GOODEAATRI_019739 [Goodea atripinnis]|uniref:Uncharacterized protein n=1 Tax=Goodea atripinnis TaxID=208336 RepID=A0ABV0MJD9_9TELE
MKLKFKCLVMNTIVTFGEKAENLGSLRIPTQLHVTIFLLAKQVLQIKTTCLTFLLFLSEIISESFLCLKSQRVAGPTNHMSSLHLSPQPTKAVRLDATQLMSARDYLAWRFKERNRGCINPFRNHMETLKRRLNLALKCLLKGATQF